MDTKEKIKEKLSRLGYRSIHVYDDLANEEFPDHCHDGEQRMVVISGSIDITMNGQKHDLQAGNELIVPAKAAHFAKVGHEGCVYLVGEK